MYADKSLKLRQTRLAGYWLVKKKKKVFFFSSYALIFYKRYNCNWVFVLWTFEIWLILELRRQSSRFFWIVGCQGPQTQAPGPNSSVYIHKNQAIFFFCFFLIILIESLSRSSQLRCHLLLMYKYLYPPRHFFFFFISTKKRKPTFVSRMCLTYSMEIGMKSQSI